MSKNILVTGIGGNQGQGILRNIIETSYNVRLIGTNTDLVSGGNHLCDEVYKTPFSASGKYVSTIEKICSKESVDLIIPSTDYEVYFLSKHRKSLPTVVAPNPKIAKTFLDKYETWRSFKKNSIPFAESILPSNFSKNFDELIVKPREGRGSREIYYNPLSPDSFSDKYIIQKYYKGIELTTAFYSEQSKNLLGSITFKRDLTNGYTSKCEVRQDFNKKIQIVVKKMIKSFNLKGPYNIQWIFTNEGEVVPFEINGRLSGTNSIRSQFGFKDVKYVLDEYLFGKKLKTPIVSKGSATRIVMDVIYPGSSLQKVKNNKTKHYIF